MRKRLKNKREKEIKNMQNLQIKTYREKTERREREIESKRGERERARGHDPHTLWGNRKCMRKKCQHHHYGSSRNSDNDGNGEPWCSGSA